MIWEDKVFKTNEFARKKIRETKDLERKWAETNEFERTNWKTNDFGKKENLERVDLLLKYG